MRAAELILAEMDRAGLGAAPRAARIEPVAIRHRGESQFGLTLLGANSIADLQNLMANYASRMQSLSTAYAAASGAWSQKDQAAFVDWTNDWTNLQNRYNTALNTANSEVTAAQVNPLPNTEIAAQSGYDALVKAFRQCYPPDGCPQAKGDYEDLAARLTAAAQTLGTPAPVYTTVQPTVAQEGIGGAIYTALAPADAVAMATGQTQPPAGPDGLSWPAWIAAHQQLLLIGGLAVGGLILLGALMPVLKLAGAGAQGVSAGVKGIAAVV